jgi:arylsulfatase A-like enzyme
MQDDSIFRFALWAGLLTGLTEAGVLFLKRFLHHRMVSVGDNAFWMAPLAEALIFVAVAGLVALFLRAGQRRWRWGSFALIWLSGYSVLTAWGRLHWVAALLLALGAAFKVSAVLSRHLAGFQGLVRRTLIPLVVLVAIVAGVVWGKRWWADRMGGSGAAPAGAPNVLLIILDTVRSFNLGLYGHQRSTTPELAEWADQATVMERALAPSSWTLPSHVMMLTGDWRAAAGVAARVPMGAGGPTLAEILSANGYATGGFVGNLVYTKRSSGLSRGFHHYEDYPRNLVEFLRSATLARLALDATRWKWAARHRLWFSWKPAPLVSEGALDWIERHRGHPWFAFLNFMEAHDPWFVPAPFDTTFGADARRLTLADLRAAQGASPPAGVLDREERAYDGAIRYLDHEVAGLLASLRRQDLLDNTVVIITSDHGEQFGDHGVVGHGTTLYRPVVQVPLIVLAPGCPGHGLRQPVSVSLADLPATILALAHIAAHPLPGRSFDDLVCGGSRPAGALLSMLLVPGKERDGFMVSVVADSLRYIRKRRGNGELYDFERDPWETRDLGKTPAGAAEMERLERMIDTLLPLQP